MSRYFISLLVQIFGSEWPNFVLSARQKNVTQYRAIFHLCHITKTLNWWCFFSERRTGVWCSRVALWGESRLETGGNCQDQLKHNLLLRNSLKYCNYVAQLKNLPISDSPTLLVDRYRVSYKLLPSSLKPSRKQSSHRINTVLFCVRVKTWILMFPTILI